MVEGTQRAYRGHRKGLARGPLSYTLASQRLLTACHPYMSSSAVVSAYLTVSLYLTEIFLYRISVCQSLGSCINYTYPEKSELMSEWDLELDTYVE